MLPMTGAKRERKKPLQPFAKDQCPIPTTPCPKFCSTGVSCLNLEATRPSAATGALELAALAGDVGLLVLVGAEAEVLDGLARVLGAAEEERVGARGLLESELVEGQGLAAGSLDARAGSGGEAQGGDVDLGDVEEAVVIGDGADNNDRLLLVAVLEVGGNAREGDGGAVDAAHKQAAEHDLVESRVGTAWVQRCQQSARPCRSKDNSGKGAKLTGQEAVKLHQELEVHIVALGSLAVRVPLVVLAQIDTCKRGRLRQPLGPVCSFGRSTEPRGCSVQLQAPLS